MSALRALHGDFNTLPHTRGLRGRDRSQSFILGLLARFASLWFVLESLVVKKNLLACSPNKVFVTVNAPYWPILIFGFVIRYQHGGCFHLYHDLLPSGPFSPETTTIRRVIKLCASKRDDSFSCPHQWQDSSPAHGCCVVNWYITMAKLCQGKSGEKHGNLDMGSSRMGASEVEK